MHKKVLNSCNPQNTRVRGQREDLLLNRFSRVQLFGTPWTVARQAPLSMGLSRLEYWNGLLFPSPGDLPDPGIETVVLTSPASAGRLFTTSTTWSLGTWRTWGTFSAAAEAEGTGLFCTASAQRKENSLVPI